MQRFAQVRVFPDSTTNARGGRHPPRGLPRRFSEIEYVPSGVFLWRIIEGYDHEEIGQILGTSEVTSRSQYARAKRRLLDIIHNRTVS